MTEQKLMELVEQFRPRLSKIKVALFDVDGILTDGTLLYENDENPPSRTFSVLDGFGIKLLAKNGLKVGVISGGSGIAMKKRATHLGLHYVYLGNEDKRGAYLEIKQLAGVNDDEILYMGDEPFDVPLLKRVGFAATCPEASLEAKKVCHYITEKSAGRGCVREVIEILKYTQNLKTFVEDF